MLCKPNKLYCYRLFLVTISLIALGCGGHSIGRSQVDSTAAKMRLDVLPESFLDGPEVGDFDVAIERAAQGLEAQISVTGARGLKACYFRLEYDPLAFEPYAVLTGTALASGGGLATTQGELLELAVLTEPGTVHHGQVLIHPETKAGLTGDGVLATVLFKEQPFSLRSSAAPPVTDASQCKTAWDPVCKVLSWWYTCEGDYDQNSVVAATDLTPLAQYFLAAGPFPEDSALFQVDGDGDGEISSRDITPIGINFGRSVEGYEVYASFDPADIPAGNDEPPQVEPYDFVPFTEGLGNPKAERLLFAKEYPGLASGSIVWVRPVSEAEAGTPGTRQAAMPYEWVLYCPSDFSHTEAGLSHLSHALIAGVPAALYGNSDGEQLIFQRALDPSGAVWDSETAVNPAPGLHYAAGLLDVQGAAGVCYHTADTGEVVYQRAADPSGTDWTDPLVIDTTGSGGWDCHLLEVDASPAVFYTNPGEGSLMYCRALDPLGAAWGTTVAVASMGVSLPGDSRSCSPALVAGRPAVAYFNNDPEGLRFCIAADPLGNTWEAPVSVESGEGVGRYCSLAMVQDAPAIAYRGGQGLAYVRALGPAGIGWGVPLILDNRDGIGASLDSSLALIDGQPAISYYSGAASADLMFVRSLDETGALWEQPQAIDTYNHTGRLSCMRDYLGFPTVAYFDESARQVMFASSGTPNTEPPVAHIEAYPVEAEVSETITLDASRSYAPRGAIQVYKWDLDGDGSFESNSGMSPLYEHGFSEAGYYYVGVQVTDGEGLVCSDYTYVSVGNLGQPPIAEIHADPRDAALGQNVHLSTEGSADSDGAIVKFEWDLEGDGDFELDTGLIDAVDNEYSVSGVYNAAVRITDDMGLSDITSVCVNIGVVNQRPVAALTASPLTGNPPFTVLLDGSASIDPDGSISSYEWDVDNDGVFEYNSGPTATFNWQCETPGDHRVRLQVTDNLQAKDSTWILVGGNQPPVAILQANASNGTAPYTITLDATASYDPDGTIVAWAIDVQNDGIFDAVFPSSPGTWQFTNIWNGITPIRLAVRDNDNLKSYAVINVTATKGWHVRTIDPVGWTGLYNSLEIINGQPAIAYYEVISRSMKFVRANDTYGYSGWANPLNLGVIAPPGSYSGYGKVSMAWVAGSRPAIAFNGYANNYTFYALAKDSQGAAWNPFVVSPGQAIWFQQQLVQKVVNNKPAIAYWNVVDGLSYVQAKDYQGMTWDAPQVLDPYGSDPEMGLVGGNPAVVYSKLTKVDEKMVGVLYYVRAVNADGTQWSAPVVIDNTNDCGAAALAIIEGRPAVGYVAYVGSQAVGYEVRYKRADNSAGSSWPSSHRVVKQDGRVVFGLEDINYHPAIALATCQGTDIMYFVASDSVGNSWPQGVVVDDLQASKTALIGTPPLGDMVDIKDHPAISYYVPADGDLKYAVLE